MEHLVKQYQEGDKSVREEIELLLWPEDGGIVRVVINSVCGRAKQGFLNQAGEWGNKIAKSEDNKNEEHKMYVIFEPFKFNNCDIDNVFEAKLSKALDTYNPNKGARFQSWFYRLFEQGLIDLKREYIKEHTDGITLRNIEQYKEMRQRIYGSPIDNEIIKHETSFTDNEIEKLSIKQKEYFSLILNLALRDANITDETAGKVLNVSRRQVQRYKEQAREIFKSYGLQMGRVKSNDDVPDPTNEYGQKDETPRKAVLNIKYKILDDD